MVHSLVTVFDRIMKRWPRFLLTYFAVCTLTYAFVTMTATAVSFSPSLLLASWVLFAVLAAAGDALVGFVDEWLLGELRRSEHRIPVDAPGRLVLISGFFGGVVALTVLLLGLVSPTLAITFNATALTIALLAGILEVIWMIPYFTALQRGGAVSTTPLFQTIPIFSLLIGVLLFAEVPTPLQLVAATLIIIGGIALNYDPRAATIDRQTLTLMLLSSFVISLGYFAFKSAVEMSTFLTAVVGNGIGMTLFSATLCLGSRSLREQFGDFLRFANTRILLLQSGNEALYAASTLAAQYAIVLGPSVMLVTAFNALHPLFTLLIGFGLTVLGLRSDQLEFAPMRRFATIAGCCLIAGGAALIVV